MSLRSVGVAFAFALLAACSFEPLDLEGRACPCATGFTCVADRCVRDGTFDAGVAPGMDGSTVTPDAGLDARAASPDAGDSGAPLMVDAGGADTGPPPLDSGSAPLDSGSAPMDASRDAGSLAVDAGPCHEQTLRITAGADDGEIEDLTPGPELHAAGEFGLLDCGAWSDTVDYPVWCYFRFAVATPIPATATVVEAYLDLQASGSRNFTGMDREALRLAFENTGNAPAVTSPLTDVMTRAGGLTSRIRWPASGPLTWPVAGFVRTPNMAALVNNLIRDHGAFGVGDHMQVWIGPDTLLEEAVVSTPDSLAGGAVPASLLIRWCD